MKSDWSNYKLKDLIDIKHGWAFKGQHMDENESTGPIVVAIGNFNYSGGFRFSSTKLKRYNAKYPSEYILSPGDLLLAMTCQTAGGEILGIPGIIPNDENQYLHNQRLGKVIVKRRDLVSLRYLYWVFLTVEFNHFIFSSASGTKILHTSPAKMLQYETFFPPLSVQNEIADHLWNLTNKIELNTQINQTLEQIAQAIFKSWFVDFDPVRAKMAVLEEGGTPEAAERAAQYAISDKDETALEQMEHEMPEAYAQLTQTAALFPLVMVESELGEIPEGWRLSEIGDEVKVVGGGTPSTKQLEFWDGNIHWTTPKDLSNINEKVLIDTDRKITEEGLKKISSGLLPIDTVLMSSRAPVGYLALAKVPVAVNQGYIAMKCEDVLSPEFVLQWCYFNLDDIKQRASGTTFAEISKKAFKPIPVVVPTEALIEKFSCQVSRIYSKIEQAVRETNNLSEIRDTLLPKLLNGGLDLVRLEEEPQWIS